MDISITNHKKQDNTNLPPILIVHGNQDPVVPVAAAQQAKDKLTAIGVKVQYQEFTMGHEIQPSVLTLLQKFIIDVFHRY